MNLDHYKAMLDKLQKDCQRTRKASIVLLIGASLVLASGLLGIIGVFADCLHGSYLWAVIIMLAAAAVVTMTGALMR